jgi:predicted RNA-binding Zn ribbon-like protein
MKLLGGHPALDFVNTVGGRPQAAEALGTRVRDDKLLGYSDLVAFAVHGKLLEEPTARALLRGALARPAVARAMFHRAVVFREALYRTLRALMRRRPPAPSDLEVLNAEVQAFRSQEALVARGTKLGWESRARTPALEAPLLLVLRAASELVTSSELESLRLCGGEDCGWLFLDQSRNGRRRWCSMEDCGNLDKVRRFRQRAKRSAR